MRSRNPNLSADDFPGGVIVVDKPGDMTSANVVRRLKRLCGIRKVGHAGTLDPFATGVLVCPINQGTRLSRFFLGAPKKYSATLRLGITTDTQDHTGTLTCERTVGDIAEHAIKAAFAKFTGEILQVPPVYSALKHKGVPLYKHARGGNPIYKPARRITISSLSIRDVRLPEIDFDVTCSAGTYIRTLCEDIGEELNCGGHLNRLERLESSGFTRKEAIPLSRLEAVGSAAELRAFIYSMADSLRTVPAVTADRDLEQKIRHGRPLAAEDLSDYDTVSDDQNLIKIKTMDNRLIAVVQTDENKSGFTYCCVFHYP